ncbi:hypothetical protein FRAHR75_10029 [Frankia sp. Hr75.2]|nr:hypothetical protein FRAHR75_10029 [Frankia sp. Hr75.2]
MSHVSRLRAREILHERHAECRPCQGPRHQPGPRDAQTSQLPPYFATQRHGTATIGTSVVPRPGQHPPVGAARAGRQRGRRGQRRRARRRPTPGERAGGGDAKRARMTRTIGPTVPGQEVT